MGGLGGAHLGFMAGREWCEEEEEGWVGRMALAGDDGGQRERAGESHGTMNPSDFGDRADRNGHSHPATVRRPPPKYIIILFHFPL